MHRVVVLQLRRNVAGHTITLPNDSDDAVPLMRWVWRITPHSHNLSCVAFIERHRNGGSQAKSFSAVFAHGFRFNCKHLSFPSALELRQPPLFQKSLLLAEGDGGSTLSPDLHPFFALRNTLAAKRILNRTTGQIQTASIGLEGCLVRRRRLPWLAAGRPKLPRNAGRRGLP